MSKPNWQGCVQRDALIATLQQRIDELERQMRDLQHCLGLNASNLLAATLGQPTQWSSCPLSNDRQDA